MGPASVAAPPKRRYTSQLKVQFDGCRAWTDTPHQTGINAASQPGEKVGHHKGQELPGKGIHPHRLSQGLIIPDGHETQPNRGIDQPVHDQQG